MKKLILFDIDGTLLINKHSDDGGVSNWQDMVVTAIYNVFRTYVNKPDPIVHNGMIDRGVMWSLASEAGITLEYFSSNFSALTEAYHQEYLQRYANGLIAWQSIPTARMLVKKIRENKSHHFGLITGNFEINAWFKLRKARLSYLFEFGAFSDLVEDRPALAALAVTRASEYFQSPFMGADVIVIGDTKHDIRAGKSIGATTIGVLTGASSTRESLVSESPDLVVNSLMDSRVLNLIGLV